MFRLAIAAVTGEGDWQPETLKMPPLRSGQNADHFKPQSDIVGILSQHEVVVLQHYPPVSFIKRLKDAGTKEVFLWTDFESMPASPYWSPLQYALWQVMSIWRLYGRGNNSFGLPLVDLYETSPNGPFGKPHSWAVRITATGYADAFCKILGETWAKAGYTGLAQPFFDNVLERQYLGTATNKPEPDSFYPIAWDYMLSTLRKLNFQPGGNCGVAVSNYQQLGLRYDERFFTQGDMAGRLSRCVGRTALGVEGSDAYATDQASWWTGTFWPMEAQKPLGVNTLRTAHWLFDPPPRA